MRINHNIMALNAHRQLSSNTTATGKALEKLSSGLRINRAGDDAAGLAISEKMRGQIRGLEQAQRNAQDGISLIQTAEGALNETHSILQRMRELAVQAASDTNTLEDRREIQKEMNQMIDEIDKISEDTEFNQKKLLDGTLGGGAAAGGETSYTTESTALDLATTPIDIVAGTNDEINITLADGATTATITLTAATYDGTAATLDDLVADIQAKIAADADLSGAGITVGLNDAGDALVFTADEEVTLNAGTNDALADLGITDGTALAEAADDGAGAAGGAVIHIVANSGQNLSIEIGAMDSSSLGGGAAAGGETSYTTESTALDLATTPIDIVAGTNDEINITLADGATTATITLTAATYDGTAATLDDLVADIQAKIAADADLSGAGITVGLNDAGDALVFTADEEVTLNAGTNDALADLGITDGTALAEAADDGAGAGGSIQSLRVDDATIDTAETGGVLTQAGADAAIENIQSAIEQVSAQRSKLGAYQNRLEHRINNLGTSAENLTASESRIRDVDMAKEMMEFTKNNILSQAAQAMLAQANQQPQGVLQLLG